MVERYGKSSKALGRTFLREWRVHRGLTQEQLADAIQTTHVTISRMERGDRPYNQPFLEACADVLGCSPADLLAGPPASSEFNALISQLRRKTPEELEKIISMISLLEK